MGDRRSVYLDHAATTPLDGRVLEAMMPFLESEFGNASSPHGPGRRARFAVEDARERIAAHIGAEPGEIVFTSGGTEANNLALWGLASVTDGHIMACETEHESVLEPLRAIADRARRVLFVPPTPTGAFPVDHAEDAVADRVSAISAMHTNNETGALNDVVALSSVCHAGSSLLHSDCVQALGWADLNVDDLGVDLMTLSAHKIGGPKGAGVLFVRSDSVDLPAFVRGGAQERGRRGGTENVSSIVGFAKALDLAVLERDERVAHLRALKERLAALLASCCPSDLVVNTPSHSAPHILSVSFPPLDGAPVDGEMLLLNLDVAGIYASSGSACTSGALEPSHVLLAMGVTPDTAEATIRFSFGNSNTLEEMEFVAEAMSRTVSRMRARIA